MIQPSLFDTAFVIRPERPTGTVAVPVAVADHPHLSLAARGLYVMLASRDQVPGIHAEWVDLLGELRAAGFIEMTDGVLQVRA